MTSTRAIYEALLSEYSNHEAALSLLQQYRPYVEMVPSIRRIQESIITLPLPVVKLRSRERGLSIVQLPCDLAYLMCDPEWKIKMGGEIIVLVQRPGEHFSDLLGRWRQTQVLLDGDYEWTMPNYYRQLITEGGDRLYPLFVLSPHGDERVARGLTGAHLPYVIAKLEVTPEKPSLCNDSEEQLS